ncbi:MAG TPA: complex I NDUFA9 subunit family protein [Holosporales bacterium]|nr:complex I NDUFA9 subunit family protein [Holosporales bacterium]
MRNKIITVFGGSGFLGRSVIQRLAQQGARVRVAVRNTDHANHLRVYGDVGQIMPVQVTLSDAENIEAVCKNSHAVINLLGILYEKGTSTFEAVHVKAIEDIAVACAKHSINRLIHISALGADLKSESNYARTKALGEQKGQAAFKEMTVIRPGLLFGAGDDFFNRFADLAKIAPLLTLFDKGKTKLQPIYVGDVAQGIMTVLKDSTSKGKLYELGGDQIFTFKELMGLLLKFIDRPKPIISFPDPIGKALSYILQFMPKPLVTPDQLRFLKNDAVVGKKSKTLKDLSIVPKHLEAIVPPYLAPYKPRF